jgi:nitroreductase
MKFKELVLANRSYRRFDESKTMSTDILMELIDLARNTPSAANLQSLKYIISLKEETNKKIFPLLAWARALKDWGGPKEGERPVAYIIICLDKNISQNPFCDHGIAAQTILLGAAEQSIGGCMIASFNKNELINTLTIKENLDPLLVIAFGFPSEKVVLEDIESDGSTTYYRDKNDVHHVPKRKVKDIIAVL